jgi:MFS family permease
LVAFKTLQPLKRRAFATVWTASIVSDIGTWMQLTVLGMLVAKSSKSALAVGMVMAAQFIPGLFGAPFGGLCADRFDRRKALFWALCAQTIITIGLAALISTGEHRAGPIAMVVLLQGLATSFGNAISNAMQPDLVPKEELLSAVSLGTASWNTGRVIGPAVGFIFERTIGATGAIVANAASFFVLAFAVWSLRQAYPPAGSATGSPIAEIRFGIRTLWATPGCRAALQGIVPMQFFFAPLMGLLPVVARELGGGQAVLSGLSSSQGVGAILGAAVLPMLVGKIGRDRTLIAHWVVTALLVTVFGFITHVPAAVVTICLFGGAFTGVLVSFMSLIQRDAPAAARGRVMSIFMACMGPLYGAGILFQSLLSDLMGRALMQRTMGACAVMLLVLSLSTRGWSGWKSLRPASRSDRSVLPA